MQLNETVKTYTKQTSENKGVDGLSDLGAKMADSATAIRDSVISVIVNVTSRK